MTLAGHETSSSLDTPPSFDETIPEEWAEYINDKEPSFFTLLQADTLPRMPSSIRLTDKDEDEDDEMFSGPAQTFAWMPPLTSPPTHPHALGISNLFGESPSPTPHPDPPVVPLPDALPALPHNVLSLRSIPHPYLPLHSDIIAEVEDLLTVIPLGIRQLMWDKHFADEKAAMAKRKMEEIRLQAEMRKKMEEKSRKRAEKERQKAERKRSRRDASPLRLPGTGEDGLSMLNASRIEHMGGGAAAPSPALAPRKALTDMGVNAEPEGDATKRHDIVPALKRKADPAPDSALPKLPKKKVKLVEPLGERSPSSYPTPVSSPCVTDNKPKGKETNKLTSLAIPPTPASPAHLPLPPSSFSSPAPPAPKCAPRSTPKPAPKARSKSVHPKTSVQTPGVTIPQELFDNSLDPDILLDPEYNPNTKHLGLVSKGFNSCLHCRKMARKCTEARPWCSECNPTKNSHRGPCIYEAPRKGNKHKPFHKDPWVLQAELGGAYFGQSNSEEWPPKEYVDAVWERLEREGVKRADWEERKAREGKEVKGEKLKG